MSLIHSLLIIIGLLSSCNFSPEQYTVTNAKENSTLEIAKPPVDKATSSPETVEPFSDKIASSVEEKVDLINETTEKKDEIMNDKFGGINKADVKPARRPSEPKKDQAQIAESKTEVESKIPSATSSRSVDEQEVQVAVEETRTSTTVSQPKVVKTDLEEPKEEIKEKQIDKEAVKPRAAVAEGHAIWNGLLSKYVSNSGNVDYGLFKKNEAQLDSYLSWLSSNAPSKSDRSQKAKAFWINAYNAYTVKLIVKNYPVNSITDLHGGKPWDVSWIKLGDNTYSLNNIEHDILRPIWKDARIHFAVNCAAKSCPPIANKAFTVGNMDSLLETSTKKFINNSSYNSVSSSSLTLSKIFDWYKEDFGDLTSYINKYSSVSVGSDASISFNDYNWSLNGK